MRTSGEAEDVANVVAFLASDKVAFLKAKHYCKSSERLYNFLQLYPRYLFHIFSNNLFRILSVACLFMSS